MDCAIVYDFDGTLAEGNCAEHSLMSSIGIKSPDEFWQAVSDECRLHDRDRILTYLGLLALYARQSENSLELTPERLRWHGSAIPLFEGVEKWFTNINEFASSIGLNLKHYIISSGLEDMIKGTKICGNFQKIFACSYHYDEGTTYPKWPCVAVNYTTKTQYLFRINKGVENYWDDAGVNKYMEPNERPLPFERMIFIGDGDTDIPSMKMVKEQGGFSMAVFDENRWREPEIQEKIEKLISEDRVSYVAPANYCMGTQLDVTIRGILRLFQRRLCEREI